MTALLQIAIGFSIGWSAGWLTSWWVHRHTRRARRAEHRALREAQRTLAAAGPILDREITRIHRELIDDLDQDPERLH